MISSSMRATPRPDGGGSAAAGGLGRERLPAVRTGVGDHILVVGDGFRRVPGRERPGCPGWAPRFLPLGGFWGRERQERSLEGSREELWES